MEILPESPEAAAPRAVVASRAFAWYEEAMRLFKRAPMRWCMLGFLTLVAEIGLEIVPEVGVALSRLLIPVVACGMLFAAAAVDRGALPQLRHTVAALSAPAVAVAAIIASELVVFVVEVIAGYTIGGVNMLSSGAEAGAQLSLPALLEILTLETLVSLPLMFVPFAVLFEGATFGAAFSRSWRGFALNIGPLVIYGLLSLLLIGIGLLTSGIALVVVFPLMAAASYAAWKDIYAAPPARV